MLTDQKIKDRIEQYRQKQLTISAVENALKVATGGGDANYFDISSVITEVTYTLADEIINNKRVKWLISQYTKPRCYCKSDRRGVYCIYCCCRYSSNSKLFCSVRWCHYYWCNCINCVCGRQSGGISGRRRLGICRRTEFRN